MDGGAAHERRAVVWPWLFGAILAVPTLLVRSPPMTDLPMRAGAVGLLLHWGDASFVPPGLYSLNIGHPDQLFYAVAYAACALFGPRVGVGLAVAVAQVGIVGGAGIFARHVRAPWWASLWLAPLALGWMYFWGHVPNMYGLALFLPTLVLVDRLVERPTARGSLVVTAAYALLFFAHATALAAAIATHALLLVLRPRTRAWIAATAPAVVAIAATLVDLVVLAKTNTAAQNETVGALVFTDPLSRARDLPETIFGEYPAPVLVALIVLFAGAVYATFRAAPPRAATSGALRARLWSHRFAVAGLGLLLAYFVVPYQALGVVTMLNARFASYAWALLFASACAGLGTTLPASRGARLALFAGVAAFLALPAVAAPAFAQSHRMNVAFDRVIAKMETGQASIVQRLHPRAADDLFNAVSCGRVLQMRGGRCQFDFTRTTLLPVRMNEPFIWSREAHLDPNGAPELRLPDDFRAYRYAVFCCAADDERDTYAAMLAPYATLTTSDEGWLLFESRLPRIAVNAPDTLSLGR